MSYPDLSTQRFGKLTVIGLNAERSGRGRGQFWNCICDCGKSACVQTYGLLTRGAQSCGCTRPGMRIDITDLRVGMLTVLRPLEPNKEKQMLWLCICDCGNEYIGRAGRLSQQEVQSCGCQESLPIHGLSKTPAYDCWHSMKGRCYRPEDAGYANYGGRGITICAGWHNVASFINDMGQPPKGLTIDRINNDHGYWCGHCDECLLNGWDANCKWETMGNQCKNKRTNHWITANDKTMILKDWVRETGIEKSTIMNRLKRGWSEQDAVTIPPRGSNAA